MGIFKETFHPGVATQLKARQSVINSDDGVSKGRSTLLPWYLSKDPWMRMTSFVDYISHKPEDLSFDESGKLNIDKDQFGPGDYYDSHLAQKYILEGGTLYTKQNGESLEAKLRDGLLKKSSVYGSNIDFNGNAEALGGSYSRRSEFRPLGIRPMPGITDVSISSRSAYGSLMEATVNFHAWDVHQLEELEILFMRPGYTILLEWGWSQYLSYNSELTKTTNINDPSYHMPIDDIIPTVFDGLGIDAFKWGIWVEGYQGIFDKLRALREKHKYNYDGLIGYVKNFNWKFRKDGGYDCSVTLISMGEVIEGIKVDSNDTEVPNKDQIGPNFYKNAYQYTDYEKVIYSLKAAIEGVADNGRVFESRELQQDIKVEEAKQKQQNGEKAEVPKDLSEIPGLLTMDNLIGHFNNYNNTDGKGVWTNHIDNIFKKEPFIKPLRGGFDNNESGEVFEYITFNTWLLILNTFFIPKLSQKNIVDFLPLTEEDWCTAGPDSVSVDASVCLVNNSKAFDGIIQSVADNNYTDVGVNPKLLDNKTGEVIIEDFISTYGDGQTRGKINTILLNTDMLLSVFREMAEKSNNSKDEDKGVKLAEYIQNVLNKVATALGGINQFKVFGADQYGDTNKIQIIDLMFNEQPKFKEPYSTFTLDPFGLKSILRDINISSKIYPNQSTMIATAAQSRANIGDIYNSSMVIFNAGLSDRLKDPFETSSTEKDKEKNKKNIFNALKVVKTIADNIIGGIENIDFTKLGIGKKSFSISEKPNNSAYSLLKTYLLQNNPQIDFKAIIPFEFSFSLDGIAGLVIGQVFTITKDILPKSYADRNIGLIINGLSHKLERGDWVTDVKTQIVLLDQNNELPVRKAVDDLEALKEKIKEELEEFQAEAIAVPIIMNFIEYQFYKALSFYIIASAHPSDGKLHQGLTDNDKKDEEIQRIWNENLEQFLNRGKYKDTEFSEFLVDWVKEWKTNNTDLYNSDTKVGKHTYKELVDGGTGNIEDGLLYKGINTRVINEWKFNTKSIVDKIYKEAQYSNEDITKLFSGGSAARKYFFYNRETILKTIKDSLSNNDVIQPVIELFYGDDYQTKINSQFSPTETKLYPLLGTKISYKGKLRGDWDQIQYFYSDNVIGFFNSFRPDDVLTYVDYGPNPQDDTLLTRYDFSIRDGKYGDEWGDMFNNFKGRFNKDRKYYI